MMHEKKTSDLIAVMTQYGEMVFPNNDTVIGKSMQLYGEWAGIELAELARFISTGDTVLDVGGCYGTHAIAFASMVGQEGRVITFEGSDKNFEILRRNVAASVLSTTIEPNLAIISASSNDFFDLKQNKTNSGASQLISADQEITEVSRNGITLDEMSFNRVDFIKIDVEGMEQQVLLGAQKLISKFSPVIFFEVNTIAGALAAISALQGHDYQFFGTATPAYNTQNIFGNRENIFGLAMECGIFAIPAHCQEHIQTAQVDLNFPQIRAADDIALLLLQKPQYFSEVLLETSSAKTLEVPVGATYKHDVSATIKLEERLAKLSESEAKLSTAFVKLSESHAQQAAQVTVLRSETDELRRLLDVERERVRTLLDRIEFAAGLMRTPISTSLKRNLAKSVLKNFPWLSESQRAKLQRSVAKREYRQLFGVRASIENNVALAPLPVPVSKIYPGQSRDFGKIPPPVAPSELDWDTLVPSGGIVAPDPVIDIIVPVYRGFDETMRCLFSVISQVQQTPFRIVVINDCSPDTSLTQALRELANREWIVLVENPENLGFVLTCNRGMRINVQRDVLLLNSDTEVYSNWLDRMVSRSEEDETAGTLTPFSNNATICSYPYFAEDNYQSLEIDADKIDAIASQVCLSEKMIELPTAIGFCMYIRRSALNEVGLFDEHKFGKGYGEENDLSRRLIAAGWKNMFVPNVYVRHWGAVSFGVGADHRKNTANKTIENLYPTYHSEVSEFISNDPLLRLRARLDVGRLELRASKGATLFVTHSLGGGTETHVQQMREWIESTSETCVFICRPHPSAMERFYIEDLESGPTPNLPLASWSDGSSSLEQFFTALGITQIHVHHLIGHDRSAPRALRNLAISGKIKVVFTAHDYFAVCPRVNLVDGSGVYCGEPDLETCQKCIDANGSHAQKGVDIIRWREDHVGLIDAAHTVYAPSNDVKVRFENYTERSDICVREHATDPVLCSALVEPVDHYPISPSTIRRIAVLGAIGPHKGSAILYQTAKATLALGLAMEFIVIGYTDQDQALKSFKNVTITGKYDKKTVTQTIRNLKPDFIWIPSVWPETFCYTLSEAIAAGVQPITFDFGAQADRIRQVGWGTIMPLSLMSNPDGAAQFLACCEKIKPTDSARQSLIRAYPNIDSYYDVAVLE